MSQSYRPQPWHVPPPDGHRPVAVHVNVSLPPDANQSDMGALVRVSQSIITGNNSAIDRFVSNNRRQQSLNKQGYSDRFVQLDGMTARWRINNGLESLDFDIYPTGGGGGATQTADVNLDGYVAWIHGEPGGPFGATSAGFPMDPAPYNIYMNGYVLEQDYAPILPCGGYVVLFGKTAMLDPNYVEIKEQLKLSGPTAQANKVIPPGGWGSYQAGPGPTGATQEAYSKTFGYWILDWTHHLNPCQYLDFGGGAGRDWAHISQGQGVLGAPVLTKGVYFPEVGKSPLKPNGQNGLSVQLSPRSPYFGQGSELIIIDVMIAEFYDRGAFRVASQSWKVAPKPNQNIKVNDKPMLFGSGAWSGGFSAGAGISFDLAAKTTKSFSGTNKDGGAQMGPHDSLRNPFRGTDAFAGLTQDEIDAYDAWVVQEQAAGAAFNTAQAARLAAWHDKWNTTENAKLITQAKNVEAWLNSVTDAQGNYIVGLSTTTGDPTGLDRVWDNGTGHLPVYGPTQQYWWDWNHTYNGINPFPKAGGRYIAVWSLVDSSLTIFDELTSPSSPPAHLSDYGGSLANSNQVMSVQEAFVWAKDYVKTDALQQQNAEYLAIIGTKPPAVDKGPQFGKPLTDFTHSNIAIHGLNWSYTQ